jgi:hypothetical protein
MKFTITENDFNFIDVKNLSTDALCITLFDILLVVTIEPQSNCGQTVRELQCKAQIIIEEIERRMGFLALDLRNRLNVLMSLYDGGPQLEER